MPPEIVRIDLMLSEYRAAVVSYTLGHVTWDKLNDMQRMIVEAVASISTKGVE